MKENTKIAFVALTILIGIILYARYEYNWADNYIEKVYHQDDGWKLIGKQHETSFSFIKIWTWFNDPVTELLFIMDNNDSSESLPKGYGILNNKYYFTPTYLAHRFRPDTILTIIIDCENKLFVMESTERFTDKLTTYGDNKFYHIYDGFATEYTPDWWIEIPDFGKINDLYEYICENK